MSWGDYSERATAELRSLLGEGAGEKEMQRFLERHPALVPGAFPSWAGHGAWPGGMVAQPPLQGFGHRRPDFLWIARHSGAVEPVFVEIEDPGKQWLAVRPDQVVPLHLAEASSGWLVAEGAVWSAPVIELQPTR